MSRYRDDMRDCWWETVRRMRRNEPVFLTPEEERPDCGASLRAAVEQAKDLTPEEQAEAEERRRSHPAGPKDGEEGPIMRGAGRRLYAWERQRARDGGG